MDQLISLFSAAVVFGTVIMFGAMGEIIAEKAGSLNLGVPGIMYIGGIAGLVSTFFYERAVMDPSPIICILIAVLSCFIASTLAGLLFSFITITLRANQNVTGLTLTIFGAGVANFLGGSLNKLSGGVGQISVRNTSAAFRANIQGSCDMTNAFAKAFLSYGFMVYAAIILAIFLSWYIKNTRQGLALGATGENPAAADAAGINVIKYKYMATCLGAGISGMGGLFYVMDYTKGTWANDGTIEALGWLAVALVIFATWKPVNAIWGSYLFGILYWAYFYIGGLTRYSQEIFKMLPYLVTIAVLIAVSMRKKKESLPPEALGLSYFREDR